MENQPIVTPQATPQNIRPREGSDDKTMAILAHLGGIFFGLLAPLIIWLIKKDESPYVDQQAKEALNFQIFMAICMVASLILMIVLIGFVLIFIVGIVDLIFCIVAAVKTSNGENYRYPVNLRLIR